MANDLKRYLPVFIRAADDLNFSETARRLGVTSAAVSKAVRALESGLGTQLFYRSTHKLTLTDDGERLYRHTAAHVASLDEALLAVRSVPDHPRGKVRVAASYAFGRQFIVPLLEGFHARYPDVELDLLFDDQVRDLVKEQIDLGIGGRVAPSTDFVMKKLCNGSVSFVASEAFLQVHGRPDHPRQLLDLPCVRFRSHASGELMRWPYVDETGDVAFVDPPAKFIVSSQELLCDLAAQGLGVAMVGLVAQAWIRAGELTPILEEWVIAPPPLSIYYASGTNLPPKVRVFIDYITEHMQDPATWNLATRAR
ncbi:MAG: LysR family transcriptional regulator [Deltaproteobacteria bacterium]|nr:MAG: LysR family transcriptional regulator [Deltaproteobacteria bacterium]